MESAAQQLPQQAQGLLRQIQTTWQRQLVGVAGHSNWQQVLPAQSALHPPALLRSSRCWQQCHGYKTAADHARARNKKGIVDGGLYLVSPSLYLSGSIPIMQYPMYVSPAIEYDQGIHIKR
jgi:hypothetical protein